MALSTTIETLREALAPMEALRGEQSQLESWVRESFTAMDALHGELSDWQRDLTRQQAQLDQREAAVEEGVAERQSEAMAAIEGELAQSREEMRKLEDENSEQLQTLEELDRQLAIVKAELRLVHKHSDELSATLDTERERTSEEHRQWTAELREMRRLMERQGAMLERISAVPPAARAADATNGVSAGSPSEDAVADEPDVGARAAELRRRANSRRAAQQRRPS